MWEMWRNRVQWYNTRMCLGLGDRAGRGERARQWRQEQENWEIDVMMKGLD